MQTVNQIRDRREKLGYTQAELADLIGTTRQTIANWESNRSNPSAILMPRLSEALKKEPKDLVPGWSRGAARRGGPRRQAAA